MHLDGRRMRSAACLVAVAILVVALAGCGSTSSSSTASAVSSPASATSGSQKVSSQPYTGPEASLPKSYPPFKITGKKVTIGISCPVCAVPDEHAQVQMTAADIRKLGGTPIMDDAGGSVQMQLSQVKQMIVQGAQAIILQPLDASTMAAAFKLAQQKGVAIIGISDPGNVTEPLQPGEDTNVEFGMDQMTYNKMRYLASALPKGSQFAVLGYGVPNAAIEYSGERYKYWGQKFGLKFDNEVDVQTVTPSAGQVAGTSIFSRYPDVKAVLSFSDEPTAGVVVAARLAGKPDVIVCGNDYDANGVKLVSSGHGCDTNWNQPAIAQQTADAAYEEITKQNLPLPKEVTSGGGTFVTPSNYKSVKSY